MGEEDELEHLREQVAQAEAEVKRREAEVNNIDSAIMQDSQRLDEIERAGRTFVGKASVLAADRKRRKELERALKDKKLTRSILLLQLERAQQRLRIVKVELEQNEESY